MGRVPGIVKWLLAPALAAFVGYGVIGPRMAGRVTIPKVVQERVDGLAPEPAAQETPAAPPPKVTVEARPLADLPAKDDARRPRRKRHRRAVTPAEAPPEPDPTPERAAPDPASTP